MLVGRIEDNVVYDNGNVKQGMIGENGKLWACGHTYVGEAHGVTRAMITATPIETGLALNA